MYNSYLYKNVLLSENISLKYYYYICNLGLEGLQILYFRT